MQLVILYAISEIDGQYYLPCSVTSFSPVLPGSCHFLRHGWTTGAPSANRRERMDRMLVKRYQVPRKYSIELPLLSIEDACLVNNDDSDQEARGGSPTTGLDVENKSEVGKQREVRDPKPAKGKPKRKTRNHSALQHPLSSKLLTTKKRQRHSFVLLFYLSTAVEDAKARQPNCTHFHSRQWHQENPRRTIVPAFLTQH